MSDYRPTEEAVAHFRQALEHDLDWMEESAKNLEGSQRAGYERAIRMMRYRTLGNEQGCVVTAFDRRGPNLRKQLDGEEPHE